MNRKLEVPLELGEYRLEAGTTYILGRCSIYRLFGHLISAAIQNGYATQQKDIGRNFAPLKLLSSAPLAVI